MAIREDIYNITNGKCAYCGCKLDYNNFHLEHFIPKSKNGVNYNNLIPSCPTCNLVKGDLLLEDFRNKIESLAYVKNGKIGIINKYWKIKPKKIKFYFEEKKIWKDG